VHEEIMVPVGGVDPDAMAIVPTGTVTFVPTDVERSTLLWEEQGDVMAAVMARCHDLVTERTEARGEVRPAKTSRPQTATRRGCTPAHRCERQRSRGRGM